MQRYFFTALFIATALIGFTVVHGSGSSTPSVVSDRAIQGKVLVIQFYKQSIAGPLLNPSVEVFGSKAFLAFSNQPSFPKTKRSALDNSARPSASLIPMDQVKGILVFDDESKATAYLEAYYNPGEPKAEIGSSNR